MAWRVVEASFMRWQNPGNSAGDECGRKPTGPAEAACMKAGNITLPRAGPQGYTLPKTRP